MKTDKFFRHQVQYDHIEMIGFSLFIGIVTGITSIGFNYFLNFFHNLIFDSVFQFRSAHIKFILIPILGGVFIGIIKRYFIDSAYEDFGVVAVMEELEQIHMFLMKPKDVCIKTIGTIITLGTGLSAGRLGPIVHLGGAVGSNIAYRFGFDKKKIRILIGCGVAGSIAGIFNSPIFAAIFVLEILMHKKHFNYFTPIVISPIVSVLITRNLIGDQPFFNVNGNYGLIEYRELAFYILLGFFLGMISILYTKSIAYVRNLFKRFHCSVIFYPIIGAVVVAFVGYFIPFIFDIRYKTIVKIVLEEFDMRFIILLFIGKFVATAVTIGSGGIGGVFVPGLYLGATFGKIFGMVLSLTVPQHIYNVNTYSFVAMGALFAGFADAPITATIMLLEFTNNYEVAFPVLIACTVSSATAKIISGDSIYVNALKRKGIIE